MELEETMDFLVGVLVPGLFLGGSMVYLEVFIILHGMLTANGGNVVYEVEWL